MSANEQDLQLELRLMAYLDRQLPAAEAERLEAELARDEVLAARFARLKATFAGLDGLMTEYNASVEAKTPPDWQASLNGAKAKFAALENQATVEPLPGDAEALDVATAAGVDAPTVLDASGPKRVSAAAAAKTIPVARNRWMHSVGAIAAITAAAVLMVFALQTVPYLPLEPRAAPLDPFVLPKPLPVTVSPEQAKPITAASNAAEITPEQLKALGLSQAQAEQFLRDGVIILSHDELPGWQSAGLDPYLNAGTAQLPIYLTADTVYNLFLTQMSDAAEAFEKSRAVLIANLLSASQKELSTWANKPEFDPHLLPARKHLQEILTTAWDLSGGPKEHTVYTDTNGELEIDRIRTAADGTWSPLLLKKVDYAWIRQRPSAMLRRWLSFVDTRTDKPEDAAQMVDCLKLWWTALQREPNAWATYCTLAGHTRYEEAGTAVALDLVDINDDLRKICGEDAKQTFRRLMAADLTTYKKPLGFLPEHTPFRDELAVAVGATHSYVDGVIANADVDRAPFVGLRQRAAAVDAFLKTQGPDSAVARWNALFSTVAKPPAAWPYQTDAWREKSDRLMAAAWVGTPVLPRHSQFGVIPTRAQACFDAFEAAPDFYHRLAALTRERASTLPRDDQHQAILSELAAWLETLSQASLDQLAGRPVSSISMPGGPEWPVVNADLAHPESHCRVALKVSSAEAGLNDLLMGNGPLAAMLILQRDNAGITRIYVGAVSNPREGLAKHSDDPQAAWQHLTQNGVLAGFHYNGR